MPPKLEYYYHAFETKNLPNTLVALLFSAQFTGTIENLQKFTNLKIVSFRGKFNQDLSFLPLSVKSLELGHQFDPQKLSTLPEKLVLIRFAISNLLSSEYFTEKIPAFYSVTHLAFDSEIRKQNLDFLCPQI